MALAQQRSKSEALIKGTTEGKYLYARPDTEDPEGRNSAATKDDRSSLLVWNGFTQNEDPVKNSPGR